MTSTVPPDAAPSWAPRTLNRVVVWGRRRRFLSGRGSTNTVTLTPIETTPGAGYPVLYSPGDDLDVETTQQSTTPLPDGGMWAFLAPPSSDAEFGTFPGYTAAEGDVSIDIEVPEDAPWIELTGEMLAALERTNKANTPAGQPWVPLGFTPGQQVQALFWRDGDPTSGGGGAPSGDSWLTQTARLIIRAVGGHDDDTHAHHDRLLPSADEGQAGAVVAWGEHGPVYGPAPLPPGYTELVADVAASQPRDSDLSAIASLNSSTPGVIASDGSGWLRKTWTQVKTALALSKNDVGLGNADNTSDQAKPVSTATATAIAAASTEDRKRANHTGQTTSASISDFTEAVQDAVAALLGAGSNVTLFYDDANDHLTISANASSSGTDPEVVRDTIGIALIGAGLMNVAVNDAADTITISTTATANSTDAQLRDRATHSGLAPIASVDGLASALAARAPSLPEFGTSQAAPVTASDLVGKTTRFSPPAGGITQPLPALTDGAELAVQVPLAAVASLTLNAVGTDVFGDGTGQALVLAPGDWWRGRGQAGSPGRWRRLSGPTFAEQDTHFDTRYPADAAAATPSRRSLGTSSVQAAAGNHTHAIAIFPLTDAATVTVDATQGVRAQLATARSAVAVAVPTGGADEQQIVIRVLTSAAVTLTFNASYELGANVTSRAFPIASGRVARFGVVCRVVSGTATWTLLAADAPST